MRAFMKCIHACLELLETLEEAAIHAGVPVCGEACAVGSQKAGGLLV